MIIGKNDAIKALVSEKIKSKESLIHMCLIPIGKF